MSLDNSIESIIESYLIKMELSYKKPDNSIWVVQDDYHHIENLVISYQDPILIFRINLMNILSINESMKIDLFKKLLNLNCTSLVHGAYGLEENNIVIIDTLQAKNIDFNEFQATIDSINIAITSDYKEFAKYLKK